MRRTLAFIAVLGGAATLLSAASGDEARWQAAVAKVQKLQSGRDPGALSRAIDELGEATYEKRDRDTVGLLVGILLKELQDDRPGSRYEEKVSGRVLDSCEKAFKKITHKEAIEDLIKHARNTRTPVRARFILCRAMGGLAYERALDVLIEIAADEKVEPRVEIGALDGLALQYEAAIGESVRAAGNAAEAAATAARDLFGVCSPLIKDQTLVTQVRQRVDEYEDRLRGLVAGFALQEDARKIRDEIRQLPDRADAETKKEEKERAAQASANVAATFEKFETALKQRQERRENTKVMRGVLLQTILNEKKPWEARIVAASAFRKDPHEADADGLVAALSKCSPADGRLKVAIMEALGEIVGIKDPKTDEPGWWQAALEARRAGKKAGQMPGSTTIEPTEFFGLTTKSTRIVFILDRTGSMDFPCSEDMRKEAEKPTSETPTDENKARKTPPPEEPAYRQALEIKKKYDARKVTKRMDALKKAFVTTIFNLDPRVQFTVIWYESQPKAWKEQLIPATWPNKLECLKDVDSLNPSGGTNIWDAMEMAYQFVADPARPQVVQMDKRGNYATIINGPDTFFLMTDGNHNQGKFASGAGDFDERAFLAEFRKVNALRKVVINTLILGDTGGDQDPIKQKSLDLFSRIAEESGGGFRHVGK